MTMRRTLGRDGFTLTEMLIAMVVFLGILGAAMEGLRRQGRGFRRGTDEMGVLQNLRYGIDRLDQEITLAGGNTLTTQPALVYAGPTTFAFNADVVSNLAGDIASVYVDPNAPAGEVSAWAFASATTVPGSSPAFSYPLADYPTSGAETVIYWFTTDSSTSRTDDFVLVRRINARPQEVLMRNVLAPTTGTFFRYWYHNAGAGRVDTLPGAWGALRHSVSAHSQLADTGAAARIDLLRAVEIRYRVTNGRTGTDERIRAMDGMVPLPNVGVKKLATCGTSPIFGQPVIAAIQVGSSPPVVELTWSASVDELAGEQDVIRYVIWRRIGTSGTWGDPFASIASGVPPTYVFPDPNVISGTTYQYAVAAQDCSPSLSPQSVSAAITIP